MSRWRPELVALLLLPPLLLQLGVCLAAPAADNELELKLSALRVHKQLLQAEIGRLYLEKFTPETPLLLEELQRRQLDIEQQIEHLEGRTQHRGTQQLALSLAADFQFLQHKLDELKLQLDAMQAGNRNSSSGHQELQRDVVNSTPKAPSSYFFTPLLAMPETVPSVGIAQPSQSSPSLIKRLMAMIRPHATSSSSSSSSSTGSSTSSSTPSYLRGADHRTESNGKRFTAEELLSQLQLQRLYLDDAIKRLELVSSGSSG